MGSVRKAIYPMIENWYNKSHSKLTFHVTQIISSHDCFGKYLNRIKKDKTSKCFHCKNAYDDRTLMSCSMWREERILLRNEINEEINLEVIMKIMIRDQQSWNLFAIFARKVMTQRRMLKGGGRESVSINADMKTLIVNLDDYSNMSLVIAVQKCCTYG